jgi:hypothetical protein
MRTVHERFIFAFLLLFFLAVGLLSYTSQSAAAEDIPLPEQISTLSVPLNQIVTLSAPLDFALNVPTATRTPTPINIGNTVWEDYDFDGRQDAGEPGMSGVTVQLWNSTKTQLLAQTTTNANGNYTVIAPIPGNYRIRVLLPNATDSFTNKDLAGGDDQLDSDINPSGTNFGFTDTFNLANNVISTTIHDAGIVRFYTPTPTRTPTPINIGNFVWDDIDQDGRQDAGEPGMAGVTVQLWNAAKTQLLAQTVTNAGGGYTVIAPLPGDYRIRVILPGMMDSFSPKDQAGGDNQLDSDINPNGANIGFTDTFNLANNVISTTIHDAGIVRFRTATPTRTPTPINFGNFVWRDLNGNGAQDAGEPGLQGVSVQLWNGIMSIMYGEVQTNSEGFYTLTGPHPGNYRVRVLLPPNASGFSPKDQAGGQDTLDSDINPNGAFTGSTDVIPVANNVISMTSLDAGIIMPLIVQPVTTLVFQGDLTNNIQPLASPTLAIFVQPLAPPTLPVLVLVDPPNICAGFRLTSPLDGLPNGGVTFYWDPASTQDVTYQITVMDEGRNILATYSSGNATSVGADISQRNIGGGFQLIVQVMALQNGRVVCTDERTILRAAPDPGVAPIIRDVVIPLPTIQIQPTRPPTRGG